MRIKVLMVCLGNICRSPLAEGILKNKVDPEKVVVGSSGTGSWHIGKPPDPRSISVARKHGIDISSQRCRQFSIYDFEEFDLIYVMDKSNFDNVIAMARNAEDSSKVNLLLDQGKSKEIEVPDPYYDTDDGFEKVYRLIDMACSEIALKISNNTLE